MLISDHSLAFCELPLAPVASNQKIYTFRCYKYWNEQAFCDSMSQVQWADVYRIRDIDNKIKFLTDNILKIFDIHAPVRTVRLSRPPAPWLTDAVKKILKTRDEALLKYKRNKSVENWSTYKNLRNFALAAVRREKSAYLQFVNSQDAATI